MVFRVFKPATWGSQPSEKPPMALKLRSSTAFIVMSVCIAIFTDLFLYGIIVPVVPFALTDRAGIPEDEVQHWISVLLAVYGAALLIASPFCGYIADQTTSRRLPLLVGLVALSGSTVMLCVGSSIAVMVVGRLLQGLSAAIVWSAGLALLVDTTGKENIGTAMGYAGIAMSMGILLAPLLSGIVFEHAGYVAVFAMAFGLLGLDILLRLLLIEKKIAKKYFLTSPEGGDDSVDLSEEQLTSKMAAAATGPNLSGNLPDSNSGEKSSDIVEAFDDSVIPREALSSSGVSETPSSPEAEAKMSKMPPILLLLTSRRILVALFGALVQSSLMAAFDSVLPLFVKTTFSWGSTAAGLIFLPLAVPFLVGPAVGWATDRYGPRWIMTAGILLIVPTYTCLRFVTHDSLPQKVLLCALLFLTGIALNLMLTPLMGEIFFSVDAKEQEKPGSFGPQGAFAQGYGLFNLSFAAGAMLGPLWAGMVRDSAGWGTMTWSLAAFAAITIIPTVAWMGGPLIQKKQVSVV